MSQDPPRRGQELTGRERQIAGLIAEGLQIKEIAQRSGLSTHTVKFHVRNVMTKIGAETRLRAAVMLVHASYRSPD